MAIQEPPARTGEARQTVLVDTFTNGLLGPEVPMLGPVADGGHIVWNPTPGCWGPMITPEFHGGHEVTRPVAVEGAKVGDAVAITIESMRVLSLAPSSGTMVTNKAAFGDDPFVDKKCPGCGTLWPASRVDGTGESSIRCVKCGTVVNPFGFEEGYTIVFDHDGQVGLTVDAANAHDFAQRAHEVAVARLDLVVVARDLRRRGIASALMRHLIDVARGCGCYKAQLLSGKQRTGAHRMYASAGFEAVAEGFKVYLDE